MRGFARQHGIRNPIDVGLDKWELERRRALEEERARKKAREETRVQMQALNEHVIALSASKCSKAFFSLPDFKCNIITLLTDCILYIKGLDATRTMPQRWPMQDLRKRSYMSTERELVAPFNLRLCCLMRETRMRTTLPG